MNRPLGAIRRLALGTAVAGAAMCVVALATVLPARAAVQLVDFYVEFYGDHAFIAWVTGSELGTVGFYLYRGDTEQFSQAVQVNEVMIAASGELTGYEYDYTDSPVVPGVTYYYWLKIIDPDGDKVFGPEPKPTPTSTSTSTRTPTATPTRTKTPTPTSTSVPTVTPSFTATAVPSSTPTSTATSTPVPTTPPAASATPVPEQASSPTATTAGLAQPTLGASPVHGERTPTATSATVPGVSQASTATLVAWGGNSQPEAPGRSSFGLHWPAIHPSTILLSISMISLFGVLLLSLALVLLRRSSL